MKVSYCKEIARRYLSGSTSISVPSTVTNILPTPLAHATMAGGVVDRVKSYHYLIWLSASVCLNAPKGFGDAVAVASPLNLQGHALSVTVWHLIAVDKRHRCSRDRWSPVLESGSVASHLWVIILNLV